MLILNNKKPIIIQKFKPGIGRVKNIMLVEKEKFKEEEKKKVVYKELAIETIGHAF